MSKTSFRRKLILYYLLVFVVFLLATAFYQYRVERQYKAELIENNLSHNATLAEKHIFNERIFATKNFEKLKTVERLFSIENCRLTVISSDGTVVYDNRGDVDKMDNHLDRPEIQAALNNENDQGTIIRSSKTTGQDYYYLAQNYGKFIVRVAAEFNPTMANFLAGNRYFFLFIIALGLVISFVIWQLGERLSHSVKNLEQFALNAGNNAPLDKDVNFSNDEIGVIGNQMISIYENLNETKKELSIEKERLFRHLDTLNQGVAIFSFDRKKLLSNHIFTNFVNLIASKPIKSEEVIFDLQEFKKLNKFLMKNLDTDEPASKKDKQFKINSGNRVFSVKCMIFPDNSFEILISNITKKVKNKNIKSQMTSNIAHELKTPVSAVRGYIETLINNPEIKPEKRGYFLDKSHSQINRLTQLIDELTTIDKLDSAQKLFKKEPVNLHKLVKDIMSNAELKLMEKKMEFECDFDKDLELVGSKELLYSIFQNLIENSINYAGENTKISLSMYNEDGRFYYFSFRDTGEGIPEQHLDRIFERFYRVDSGRTRKDGGTGLGLSIVKNAVDFHRGEISAKGNNISGGAEFLFHLRKV